MGGFWKARFGESCRDLSFGRQIVENIAGDKRFRGSPVTCLFLERDGHFCKIPLSAGGVLPLGLEDTWKCAETGDSHFGHHEVPARAFRDWLFYPCHVCTSVCLTATENLGKQRQTVNEG